MQVFLASIPLEGRRVAVVGGGEMGVAKARLLSSTPAEVLWFTPDEAPAHTPGLPEPLARWPEPAEVEGVALLFLALGPDHDARLAELAAAARASGALVNVVDRPSLSDFHTPALVDRGDVVVGIATGGCAPVMARDLRARIESALPPGVRTLAKLARELRPTVMQAEGDGLKRRRFWERALRGAPARLAEAGRESEARREMLRLLNTGEAASAGVVHIVGAGPGDPELLTLKALRLLQDADVVVHDRLVPQAVLDYARRDARRIYVGKARGDHAVPQRGIEEILVAEARAGHRVVRLKGGDPFVFGRGGEELEALRAAGIEAHVVPGVTAALGCAAAAGLPLTHRDHAHAVTFVTGRPKTDGPDVDWRGLAGEGRTLAVYMGVDRAGEITSGLLASGVRGDMPVAVVEQGSLPGQRVFKGRLDQLDALVEAGLVAGPAMLFVGETAALAQADASVPRTLAEAAA